MYQLNPVSGEIETVRAARELVSEQLHLQPPLCATAKKLPLSKNIVPNFSVSLARHVASFVEACREKEALGFDRSRG